MNSKRINFIITVIAFLFLLINDSYPIDLQLTGSLSEMYDDNINLSEEKESDFITEAMLGLGVMHEGRTLNWYIIGESTQQLYIENNNLNNNSQRAELSIAKEISYGDRLSIVDTFVHYPEPRDFEYMFGQSLGRASYYTNTFISTYSNNLLRSFFITLTYTNIYTKALSDESVDSMSNSGRIATGYEINSFNIISAFYSYTVRKILDGSETRSNKTALHTCGLGYQHFFTRRLFSNLQGGLELIKTEDDTNYNTFATASITDQIDENNTLNLSVSKRYEIAPLTNEVYDIWNYTANFIRELSPLISFSLACFYQYGDTVSDITVIKSKIIGLRTYFNYIFSENISSSIGYTYTKNKTEQTEPINNDTEYDRNQVQITLRAEF